MAKPRASKATPARLLALKLAREVRERDAYLRELVSVERAATQLPAEELIFMTVQKRRLSCRILARPVC